MNIKKKDGIYILALIFEMVLIVVAGIILNITDQLEAMKVIGWMAAFFGIYTSVIVFRIRREFNVFFIFIVLCYLFSFGQCILVILGGKPFEGVFGVSRGFFSAKELLKAAIFVLLAIDITSIGYCLNKNTAIPRTKEKPVFVYSDALNRVGWILLIITIVPTLYLLFKDISTMSTLGYGNTLVNASGIDKVFSICAGLFQSSLLILYCLEEKHRKILLSVIGIYCALQLFGGSRIAVFRYVIVFFVLSHLLRKEITRGKWILIAVLGAVLVVIFSLVSSVRTVVFMSDNLGELIKESFMNLADDNFIFTSLREMGNTQCLNTLVINQCPDKIGFNFGLSYLRSFYGVFPNFLGLAYNSVDTVFSELYTVTNAGMGSSYIAEAYWNFGYFAFIFYVFYGWLWGKLTEKFKSFCSYGGNARDLFFTVFLMWYMIFTVRSDFMEFGRSLVYYAIVPIILSCVKLGDKNLL